MAYSSEIRRPLLIAGLVYAAGIVYGSLIPFRLRPMTWAEAWDGFQAIPFLALGATSRADWVANLLLYMPLAFLLLAALWSRRSRALRVIATQLVFAFCCALAVGVEFVQQFFIPRTVSLNDLLAEGLGAGLGVMVWWGFGERLLALTRDVFRSGQRALRAAFYLYLLALVFLAVFPFDFVVSGAELSERLDIVAGTLFQLGAFDRSTVHGVASLLGQVAVYMPLGGLLALTRPTATATFALRVGIGMAAALEAVQVFLWSGVVTIGGIVFAGLGAMAGAVAVRLTQAMPASLLRRGARLAALAALLPYLVVVVALNDLFSRPLQTPERIAATFDNVSFLPFFYHYFTTEVRAVTSMLTRIAMYAPVGAMLWSIRGCLPDAKGVGTAGLLAGTLAAAMEFGRLLVGLTPDPTNALIGAGAGAGIFALLRLGTRWVSTPAKARRGGIAREPAPIDADAAADAVRGDAARGDAARGDDTGIAEPALAYATAVATPAPLRRDGTAGAVADQAGPPSVLDWRLVPLLTGIVIAAAVLIDFPVGAWWLAAGLAGYAVLLWFRPDWWLIALPAAIGAVDLARWSGRFYVEEFDLFAVTTLAVLVARRPPSLADLPPLVGLRGMLLALLTLSYLIGLNLPDLLAVPPDVNAFNSYFSAYNGLRVSKGFFWALLLLPFLRQALRERPADAFRSLAVGLAIGLAATSVWAVAERLPFVGLFDFDTVIRVTGSFSSMHIGGGHLGAFLVLALPFLAAPLAVRMPALAWPLALGVLALAGYVLLTTFQRAAYAAFAVGFLVLVAGLSLAARRGVGRSGRVVVALALALPVCGGLAWAGLSGGFIEARFATVGYDLQVRTANWRGGLDMRSAGVGTSLFGEGLGTFPVIYLLRNTDGIVPGGFAVLEENNDRFLRLTSGITQYFEQRVTPDESGDHELVMDARSPTGGRFALLWCRKSLHYSFTCERAVFELPPDDWTTVRWQTPPPARVGGSAFANLVGSPSTLALLGLDQNAAVDVDDIRLMTPGGANLIENGDFERNTDYWFFADDNHSSWRIFNQLLMMLFERGWFGVAVFTAAVAVAAIRLLRAIGRGDGTAAILLAGLSGFLALGITESPLEAPRLGFLFFLLLFWGLARPRHDLQRRRVRRRPGPRTMAMTRSPAGRRSDVFAADRPD